MTLGVGDILSEPVKIGDQELCLDDGLDLLDALDVALLCMLAHRADGDDVIGAQHLELEVGVVGGGHEHGIGWPPKNRMVGPGKANYVKTKDLPTKVVGSPEVDGQVNLLKGVGPVPRDHAVKGQGVGP